MQADFEAKYHELEEQHWWFRGRRHMILAMIRGLGLPRDATILDIGCSGGPLMLDLHALGYTNVHGMDISQTGIRLAQARGLQNVQVMDAANLRFSDAEFDLLVASDVLEHIEDDRTALRSWYRVLKPGGRLIVFVPAFQSLWSNHDTVNRHFRRYTRSTLKQGLTQSGFRIERASYWNFTLFFPVSAARLLMRLRPQGNGKSESHQLARSNPIINASLFNLLRAENQIAGTGLNWPVGVSTFAVASKPVA